MTLESIVEYETDEDEVRSSACSCDYCRVRGWRHENPSACPIESNMTSLRSFAIDESTVMIMTLESSSAEF